MMIAKHVTALKSAIFKRGAWFVGFLGSYYHNWDKITVSVNLILCNIFTGKRHVFFRNENSLTHHYRLRILAKKKIVTFILPFLFLILLTGYHESLAQEQFIRLAWSPNTEPQLSYYNLYRDTVSGTMHFLTEVDKSDTLYTDRQVKSGHTYFYKLTAVDDQGYESDPSNEVMAVIKTISGDGEETLNDQFVLKQNYPNPFNPKTTIEYSLATRCFVTINIFNVLGQNIRTLVNDAKEAGNYEIEWDGKSNDGNQVPSSIYFYQMVAENFHQVKKLMLQK